MKKSITDILIAPDATVIDAVKIIDGGAIQLALVVDGDRRLLASVTDGDVRRGLLSGKSLSAPVSEIMHRDPVTVTVREGRPAALRLMRERTLRHVPVVDERGRVVGLELLDEVVLQPENDTWVAIMAGGLGVRLRPLTETVPKPMLPVGGRPLLETIIRNMADQGFRKFFISVNHQRHVIQDHFGDGSEFDVEIQYLIETERLGTAGGLSLLPERPDKAMIVMNGDLMTSIQFGQLLRFHEEHDADATLCVREHTTQIPFGVVDVEGTYLKCIDEKPSQTCLVNAGIYALSPGALEHIAHASYCDMPTVFDAILKSGGKASVFPIREYWLDIGQIEDLRRADTEFKDIFAE